MAPERDHAVSDYIATLDEQTARDAETLVELMQRVSGKSPQLWNVGTIGFGTYHYRYDSGREGDGHTIGFYLRKGKITVYVMDGTARYSELLAQLGPHTLTGYCLYLKRLSDVDLAVLERILGDSYRHIEALAQAGPIREILWKAD